MGVRYLLLRRLHKQVELPPLEHVAGVHIGDYKHQALHNLLPDPVCMPHTSEL